MRKATKKVIGFVVLVVLMMVLLTGAALAFENEPEGFRGLKWGDPPMEEMIVYDAYPLVNCYTLPDESLYLGNVKLNLIEYQFFSSPEGEIFWGIGLYFRGEDNYDLMEIFCKDEFGEETLKTWDGLNWYSQETMVILSYDLTEETGYLAMLSTPLMQQQQMAVEKLESEKAAKDW